MNLAFQKSNNMLNSLIIDWEKGKKLPDENFGKNILQKLDIFISIPNMQKYFKKTQKLREEMHFEIYKTNPLGALYKKMDRWTLLKSASPYEKTNSPASLALLSLADR